MIAEAVHKNIKQLFFGILSELALRQVSGGIQPVKKAR
jgi:hypothetical protein